MSVVCLIYSFFFFKQKTAYEMRISDWSSDVCSSDLYVDYRTGKLVKSASAYEHPQPHACFIQSVHDDLVNENGIMDLWVREARLFKYGSGTEIGRASCRERVCQYV